MKAASSMVLALCLISACGQSPQGPQPNQDTVNLGVTRECIESISAIAAANPRTNTIAANFAGPLGLTPTSDPNAAPWTSRQAEFHFSDGTGHYLAIEGPSWTKGLMIRTANYPPRPRTSFFVIDRSGNLLAAGTVEAGRFLPGDVNDPAVRADFYTELAMWRLAGDDRICGRG
jgi:hypothetical protein